ncbi:Arc family DNA-binding protein [Sedimentitalea todarodis]|uniref:Arc family DNA-binding protein n=1 Tax=Sedimentitalea todarodis TaxID=1631240 RepID=A0ABU3VHS5_9RHOB|nr:Arc family DNA-binding protein [Sedimentitalea todarodis]MDU9005738.1 Arc family DNA-binding protein [Sedimentitalea todarodis]
MTDAAQNQDKFVLRLPNGMRDKIKLAASNSNRSMNAEVVAALEKWLERADPIESHLKELKAEAENMTHQRRSIEDQLKMIISKIDALESHRRKGADRD